MVVSLIPIGLVLFLALVAPSFLTPLLDPRATLFGLPAMIGFLGALAALFAINILVARASRSRLIVGLVLGATTVIAMFLVVVAPAIILITISLKGLPD
jgi:hypothetical protein